MYACCTKPVNRVLVDTRRSLAAVSWLFSCGAFGLYLLYMYCWVLQIRPRGHPSSAQRKPSSRDELRIRLADGDGACRYPRHGREVSGELLISVPCTTITVK